MNILILSNNYKPELTGPAHYITDLAEYLAEQGNSVTVLTSPPHYPHWKLYPGHRQTMFSETVDNGVRLIRCPIYIPSNPVSFKRILYDLSFTLSSMLRGISLGDVDVVYCVSPPLTIGITAQIISLLKRCPFVIHLMDLIPDAAVALGMLKNRAIISFLRKLERHIYRHSSKIIAITEGFKNNILSKGYVEADKISVIPNWVDTDFINPMNNGGDFRERYGFSPDDFIVTYSGNMGNKQGLETLIRAASLLGNGEFARVHFVLVGEGAQKKNLSRMADRLELRNLHFFPLLPWKQFPNLLAASDVLVLTQRREVTDICLPSKLMTNCASGKPILASVNTSSETANFIRDANCGIVCEAEDPDALKDGILHLLHNPDFSKRCGERGRQHIVENYSRESVLSKYCKTIDEIVKLSK